MHFARYPALLRAPRSLRLGRAALFVALLAGAAPALAAAPPAPLVIASAEAAPDYDRLFAPLHRGFLGADGAASVAIAPDRVVWIFGDTVIGSQVDGKRQGPMVRNSIAIQDLAAGAPGSVEYFWALPDNIPESFFHPDDLSAPHWYWPGTGVMHDGRLYLFLTKLTKGDGPEAFAFQTVDVTLFRVANPLDSPRAWRMTRTDLGVGTDHVGMNAAAMIEGDTVFFIGYHDGPHDDPMDRRAILARMPVAALDADAPGAAIEYWSRGERWAATPADPIHLFKPGATESSLHFNASLGRYITISIKPFSTEFYVVSAPRLTGPWSEPQQVYDIPELARDENYLAYAGRAHPELTGADSNELLVTYVVNTRDFWSMFGDMEIYFPRFIRIRFGEPAGGE